MVVPLWADPTLLLALGRQDESLAEFRALTKVMTRVLGPEHPDTLNVHERYADELYRRGRYREAGAELAELVSRYAMVYGARDERTRTVQDRLAAVRESG